MKRMMKLIIITISLYLVTVDAMETAAVSRESVGSQQPESDRDLVKRIHRLQSSHESDEKQAETDTIEDLRANLRYLQTIEEMANPGKVLDIIGDKVKFDVTSVCPDSKMDIKFCYVLEDQKLMKRKGATTSDLKVIKSQLVRTLKIEGRKVQVKTLSGETGWITVVKEEKNEDEEVEFKPLISNVKDVFQYTGGAPAKIQHHYVPRFSSASEIETLLSDITKQLQDMEEDDFDWKTPLEFKQDCFLLELDVNVICQVGQDTRYLARGLEGLVARNIGDNNLEIVWPTFQGNKTLIDLTENVGDRIGKIQFEDDEFDDLLEDLLDNQAARFDVNEFDVPDVFPFTLEWEKESVEDSEDSES